MLKNLLYIAMLTTFVVVSWIILTVYHNISSSTISKDTTARITPIPPSFDRETIEKLKVKKVVPADLSEKTLEKPTPTPGAPSPNPILNPLENLDNSGSESASL